MGKSSKKSAPKVDEAPVVAPVMKSGKKDKRGAEEAIQKAEIVKEKGKRVAEEAIKKVYAKKHKVEEAFKQGVHNCTFNINVFHVNQKKKKPTACFGDSSESVEEEKKVHVEKPGKVEKVPVKEPSHEDSSSSDYCSFDDEPAPPVKKHASAKNGSDVSVAKKTKSSSSSDSSDSEDSSSSDYCSSDDDPTPVNKKTKFSSSSDSSDSDDSKSQEDPVLPAKKQAPAKNGSLATVAKKTKSSSSSDSSDSDDSESEEEPVLPSIKQAPAKNGSVAAVANKTYFSSSSDSSDSDDSESEEEPVLPAKKRAPAKNGSVTAVSKKTKSGEEPQSKAPDSKKVAESSSDEESSDDSSSEEPSNGSESESDSDSDSDEDEPHTTSKKRPNDSDAPETYQFKILRCGNLASDITRKDVEEFFKDAGEVVDVEFASDRQGNFKGYGHVKFATAEAASKALKFKGGYLCGRPVRLDYTTHKFSDE